jgi:predicted flavoprotein YhiN
VKKIFKNGDIFEVQSLNGKKYTTKNVIVSSGGKSFFQVGTTGEGYNFAEQFGINIIPPYKAL